MKKDSKNKIAHTYALALYLGIADNKSAANVQADIDSILNIISEDDSFIKNLSNPLWDSVSKKQALGEISKQLKLSKEMLNCLNMIVENNRAKELKEILKSFHEIYYEKNNIALVKVETVKELSAAQDKRLKESLKKYTNKDVVVEYQINPSILGGLIITWGSMQIDDSLHGKLNKIELAMKGA